MKNRHIIVQKLEHLESTLTNLQRIVNTQEPIETYRINIVKAQGLLEDVKSFIDREPRSAYDN
tara:strand:- start:353 stop:541 length:189 start_codon:yes stop_codon:yes gene_type:complete